MIGSHIKTVVILAGIAGAGALIAAKGKTSRALLETVDGPFAIAAEASSRPYDASSRDQILALARATPFDERYGVGDEQPLPLTECAGDCAYGPRAEVQPARGIHLASEKQLAAGKFVGRMINHGTQPYRSLNLGADDTTYVWVDKVNDTWRAIYVPASAGGTPVEKRMTLETHVTQDPWTQPGARWLMQSNAIVPWFPCTAFGCCKVD